MALASGLPYPAGAAAQGGPGFLFSRPKVSIGFRGGYTVPRLSSNLFEQSRTDFTLNRWDFAGPYFGGDLAVRVAERWDLSLSAGWARGHGLSEYRAWVEGGLPIEQETTFETASLAVGGRYYLKDRGRSVGRFAWVPARLAPYVGGGVGVMWYTFEQVGDFVDVLDPACPLACPIYGDALRSDGSGLGLYASAGADLSIGKQFYLTGEARYNLASAGVRDAYSLFDPIDLSGLQVTTGISLRW
jgi:hypothetical protein